MATLRIGTRGSRLALAQADWVVGRLRELIAGLRTELVVIRTSGDVIRDVALGPEHGSAFFTKEIEDALLDHRIDIAVHSCKDLGTRLPAGLVVGALPVREDPRDVLVSRAGTLAELPEGARVGTSSPRRKRFLALARADLEVWDQRGNVPTRVGAVDDGSTDAVVLAAAGIHRLGLNAAITEYLDPDVMLPAAGQGALALEIRDDDARTREIVAGLDDPRVSAAVHAERACLRRLEAGCQAPVGALAHTRDGRIELDAAVVTPDGVLRASACGAPDAFERVGAAAASDLLDQLGLPSLRDAPWAGPPPKGPGAP